MKKAPFYVHCLRSSAACSDDLLQDARDAFDESHMALIWPTAKQAFINWICKSWFVSWPVTAITSYALSRLLITGMIVPSRQFTGNSLNSIIAVSLAKGMACVFGSLAAQYLGMYSFIRHLFVSHLKISENCPLAHSEVFQANDGLIESGQPSNCLFVTTTNPEPDISRLYASPSSSCGHIAAVMVLLTGKHANDMRYRALLDKELPSDAGLIRNVGARPMWHGHGMGYRLLRACLSKAKDMGLKEVYLVTTVAMTTARKMYEAEGFEVVKVHTENRWLGYDIFAYKKVL